MDFRGFQEYKPGSSRYNGRISDDEWNKHKPTLRKLHEAKLTRQQILDIISKDFGDTKPTYGQLCTKFDKWGFHVYRQQERKENAGQKKKTPRKATKEHEVDEPSNRPFQAFSPESSNGSTIVPDVGNLDLNDKFTPQTYADLAHTPESYQVAPSSWSDSTPKLYHTRNTSGQKSTPPLGTIHEPEAIPLDIDYGYQDHPSNSHTQHWISSNTTSNLNVPGSRSSASDSTYSNSSRPSYNTVTEVTTVEPDDPTIIEARTQKANEALDSVLRYLKSLGPKQSQGNHMESMISLAAYLFATRSYSPAFMLYHKVYESMFQDPECDEIPKIGALMRCSQSAMDPIDLEFLQTELHQVLRWEFNDLSLKAFAAHMLQTVETQMSEGFNLAQGSIVATSSITKNLSHLMTKGCESKYPGTRRLYWRLRLLTHTPFHSGCTRLLRLMSEILSWAWAAMTVLTFPEPAVQHTGCLCNDGLYFDFVRMITTVVLEAAVGFEICDLIKIQKIKHTPCACIMCADLQATFEICPIETYTAIALLTVDRCRLDWTSCHPGGRHQELSPKTILREQLLPTIEALLIQVAADIQSPTTIHTSDLYDDFLSCLWSCFETHDLPLRNARFDASPEKVTQVISGLVQEELDKNHPAHNAHAADGSNGKMPVFTYANQQTQSGHDDLANKIIAKRTRSNASSLKPSSSNASERSMIRIRKKLKFRTSADYLNSMSSYSSLSSRSSMNRFSYVTGLPELETVMDYPYDGLGELPEGEVPPDLTPDEFRTVMQRHDSWSRRSDHFSWVPSRPGSTVGGVTASRMSSYRESYAQPNSRPGSLTHRTSQTSYGQRVAQNAMRESYQREMLQQQGHGEGQPGQHGQQQPQQQPQQHVIQNHNQRQFNQNDSQQQYTSMNPPPLQNLAPAQTQPTNPTKPVRRDSTKTTNSAKSSHSQKGRWSAEHERVEKILRMTQ